MNFPVGQQFHIGTLHLHGTRRMDLKETTYFHWIRPFFQWILHTMIPVSQWLYWWFRGNNVSKEDKLSSRVSVYWSKSTLGSTQSQSVTIYNKIRVQKQRGNHCAVGQQHKSFRLVHQSDLWTTGVALRLQSLLQFQHNDSTLKLPLSCFFITYKGILEPQV